MRIDELMAVIFNGGVRRIRAVKIPLRGRRDVYRYIVLESEGVNYLIYNQISNSPGGEEDLHAFPLIYETAIIARAAEGDGSVDVSKFEGSYEYLAHEDEQLEDVPLLGTPREVEVITIKSINNGGVKESLSSLRVRSEECDIQISTLEDFPSFFKISIENG